MINTFKTDEKKRKNYEKQKTYYLLSAKNASKLLGLFYLWVYIIRIDMTVRTNTSQNWLFKVHIQNNYKNAKEKQQWQRRWAKLSQLWNENCILNEVNSLYNMSSFIIVLYKI